MTSGLSKQTKVIISLSTIFGIILCGAAVYGLCKWGANKRGMYNPCHKLFMVNVIRESCILYALALENRQLL